MSSMDQVFVKAFSRRRLAEPNRDARLAAPQHEATQASDDLDSKGQPGTLELNRSVAGTAEVWVDPVVDQIARPDQASPDVPKPHVDRPHLDGAFDVDTTVAFEHPSGMQVRATTQERVEDRESVRDATEVNQGEISALPTSNPGPLQHIHTAYAGAFADPSLIAASTSLDKNAAMAAETQELQPAAENSLPSSRPQSAPVNRIADLPVVEQADSSETNEEPVALTAIESSVTADPQEAVDREEAFEDDPVIEMRIDAPTPVASIPVVTPDPAATYIPFQAVWEVDVFDVPTPVADLFFEGALFQQIAERMSDAVGSGLRTVMVTSAKPGEGRSCVAIGMAMAAAAAGIRVALVDADTESPSLADELRLDLQYGWVDVIRRGLPIKEIAVQAVEDGVTLIPLMPPGVRPAATAFEMVQLVDLLTSNFELIILDGPTSLSAGLQQCASRVDSAVIVRDVTRTDELAVCELSNRLQDAGVRGVGVVENFV